MQFFVSLKLESLSRGYIFANKRFPDKTNIISTHRGTNAVRGGYFAPVVEPNCARRRPRT